MAVVALIFLVLFVYWSVRERSSERRTRPTGLRTGPERRHVADRQRLAHS